MLKKNTLYKLLMEIILEEGVEVMEILTEEEGDEADKATTRPQWSAIIVTN